VATVTPGTPRGRARRERLVTATASLVAERGYHQVGVDEIGAAAGVSGAAIYRHFAGKQELLVAVIERAVDALMGKARRIVREASSPDDALDGLVRAHIDFALGETALIAVYDQEAHNLDDAPRRRLRRQQRAYTELWIDVLEAIAPDATREELAVAVHGAFGLLNSVADHHRRLGAEECAAILYEMTRCSLDAALALVSRSNRPGTR
jgi:AcrR family transcriptional regulator